eukprot:233624-Prymnesium_polylepis.1
MGFSANLVFNLHAGARAAVLASHAARLSPSLVLAALADLRPSCLNTVPWVVEGLADMIGADDERAAQAAKALASLRLLTYGGAALRADCAALLRKHRVPLACTYGQTEL